MKIKYEILKFLETSHRVGLKEVTMDYLKHYFDNTEYNTLKMWLSKLVTAQLVTRTSFYPNYNYSLSLKGKESLEKYLALNFGVETTPNICFNTYGD